MRVNFETEHLVIRPLCPGDAEAVFRWGSDPEVNRYMIYPLYHRVEDVRAWLESRNEDDPDKLNYELLGAGIGRHMHWHIFPRRNGDTPRPGPVWQVPDMNNDKYLPSAEKLEELKSALRKELDALSK